MGNTKGGGSFYKNREICGLDRLAQLGQEIPKGAARGSSSHPQER